VKLFAGGGGWRRAIAEHGACMGRVAHPPFSSSCPSCNGLPNSASGDHISAHWARRLTSEALSAPPGEPRTNRRTGQNHKNRITRTLANAARQVSAENRLPGDSMARVGRTPDCPRQLLRAAVHLHAVWSEGRVNPNGRPGPVRFGSGSPVRQRRAGPPRPSSLHSGA